MKRIVSIPNVGNVAFPDHMSDADVSAASQNLHGQGQKAGLEKVLQALVRTEGGGSQAYKKVGDVAQVLEQTPALLQLAIAGLDASSQAATTGGQQETQIQPQQDQSQSSETEKVP